MDLYRQNNTRSVAIVDIATPVIMERALDDLAAGSPSDARVLY